LYAQLIDDGAQKTLATATSQGKKVTGKEAARTVGTEIAKKATKAGITEVVFDRGGYSYEGNIKELADAAREGGLHF
jgi:large subunit ribosomal protein L18